MATRLKVYNVTELAVIIAAITDYVEMTEDMRIEPVRKLSTVRGAAFNECLNEINDMNRRVEAGRQLIDSLAVHPPIESTGADLFLDTNQVELIRAGLEMNIDCGAEMEPFSKLLRDSQVESYSREEITKLQNDVHEGIAKLVAMKDVAARLKGAR
jgi:hypothetical protein